MSSFVKNMHLIARKIDQPIHTSISRQLMYISTKPNFLKNIFHHVFPTTTKKGKINKNSNIVTHTLNEI